MQAAGPTRREMLYLLVAGAVAAFSAGYPQFGFAADDGNFRAIYLDPKLRAQFFAFLKNVYRLYPERDFDALITKITATHVTDREIYETILGELPSIRPYLRDMRYALPALRKQKAVMCDQTIALLGRKRSFGRYAEIGSTGRYYDRLTDELDFSQPPIFVHTDKPSYQPREIMERGRVRKVGSFVPLDGYAPLALPEAGIDVLTVYIGFHHAPADRRAEFIRSCHRALKPGGSLIVRDHDVPDASMTHFVALAHDVFNCGLELPWETNALEVRNFQSLQQLHDALVAAGFTAHERRLLQEGDPTRNTLMRFDKA